MKQAIEYARYSPRPEPKPGEDDQPRDKDCESIEWQLERLDAFCRSLDLPVAARYDDPKKSGKTTKDRPGLEAAIQHAIRIKGWLIVYDFSRLSRDPGDSLAILRRLRKGGAELRSIMDGVATDTATGDLLFTVIAGVNMFNRRVTAEKTSDAMKRHQYNGSRRMSRPDRCPYGFRAAGPTTRALEPDPAEQETIRLIKALAQAGSSYRGICAVLDERGITRRGKPWTGAHSLVAKILERNGT